MQFPFGPFAPDAGENTAGILTVADGAIPLIEGYGPMPALTVPASATAFGTAPRGVYSYQKADGSWQTVIGQDETIELLAADYTSSSIDTGLAVPAGFDFSFERYGDYLLYTNTVDGLRGLDVEAAGSPAGISDAGDPEWIFECGNILFGLNCLDAWGARDNKLIRSCRRGNHTVWTGPGSDAQSLTSGGALVWGGKVADNSALVLQQREVRLIQMGSFSTAQWGQQSISSEFGSVGARSVVRTDGAVYWLSTDGFRRFTIGGGIEHIGASVIDRWFLDRLDQSDMSAVQGTIDPFRKCVLWRYKSIYCASSAVFDDIIGYHWPTKRWFTLTEQTKYLFFAASAAVSWETFAGTWDETDIIWDSRALSGGQPLLGAISAAGKFGYFAGDNLAVTLQTAVANSPTTALINWATPIDDAPAGELHLGVKDQLSNPVTWKPGAGKTASGRVPLRGRGKNIAFRRTIPAGTSWTYARGIDHVAAGAGGPR